MSSGSLSGESSTSRICSRICSNRGPVASSASVRAFCSVTQASARSPVMSSSHRYGSSTMTAILHERHQPSLLGRVVRCLLPPEPVRDRQAAVPAERLDRDLRPGGGLTSLVLGDVDHPDHPVDQRRVVAGGEERPPAEI